MSKVRVCVLHAFDEMLIAPWQNRKLAGCFRAKLVKLPNPDCGHGDGLRNHCLQDVATVLSKSWIRIAVLSDVKELGRVGDNLIDQLKEQCTVWVFAYVEAQVVVLAIVEMHRYDV